MLLCQCALCYVCLCVANNAVASVSQADQSASPLLIIRKSAAQFVSTPRGDENKAELTRLIISLMHTAGEYSHLK